MSLSVMALCSGAATQVAVAVLRCLAARPEVAWLSIPALISPAPSVAADPPVLLLHFCPPGYHTPNPMNGRERQHDALLRTENLHNLL